MKRTNFFLLLTLAFLGLSSCEVDHFSQVFPQVWQLEEHYVNVAYEGSIEITIEFRDNMTYTMWTNLEGQSYENHGQFKFFAKDIIGLRDHLDYEYRIKYTISNGKMRRDLSATDGPKEVFRRIR